MATTMATPNLQLREHTQRHQWKEKYPQITAMIAIIANVEAGRQQQRRRRRCAHEAISIVAQSHNFCRRHTHDGSSRVRTATAQQRLSSAPSLPQSDLNTLCNSALPVGCACPPTQRPPCAAPAQRDSELLERHVTISWPKGYSRAQASLRRIAVLHCCCAEMLVCRVLIQPIAVPPCRCSTLQPGGWGWGRFFQRALVADAPESKKTGADKKHAEHKPDGLTGGRRGLGSPIACSPCMHPLPSEPSAQRPSKAAAHVLALALATRSSACPCHAYFRLCMPRALLPRVLPLATRSSLARATRASATSTSRPPGT